MEEIKVILFDLDDTLIHFDDYWEESMLETFAKHPVTFEYDSKMLFEVFLLKNEYYEDLYNKGDITMEKFRNKRLIDALHDLGKEIDDNVANDFNQLHKTISRKYMKASPQLIEFLEKLGQQYLLGIVSNGFSSWQYDKIDALGIRHLFDKEAIFISEDIGYEKPSPEIYNYALNYYKVKANEVLFIGDSWKNDVEGPNKVGIHSIWLNKKNETIPDYKNSNFLGSINDIYNLMEIIVENNMYRNQCRIS